MLLLHQKSLYLADFTLFPTPYYDQAAGFIGRQGSGDGSGTGAGAGQVDEWGFAVEGVHKV